MVINRPPRHSLFPRHQAQDRWNAVLCRFTPDFDLFYTIADVRHQALDRRNARALTKGAKIGGVNRARSVSGRQVSIRCESATHLKEWFLERVVTLVKCWSNMHGKIEILLRASSRLGRTRCKIRCKSGVNQV